jgi:hypothetical protein
MAAEDHLSEEQFDPPEKHGYLPHSDAVEQQVRQKVDYDRKTPARLDLRRPIRPSQDFVYPAAIEHYTRNPHEQFQSDELGKRAPNQRPEIARHNGEAVVMMGHHRIAAAIKRGQKSMRVNSLGMDYRAT